MLSAIWLATLARLAIVEAIPPAPSPVLSGSYGSSIPPSTPITTSPPGSSQPCARVSSLAAGTATRKSSSRIVPASLAWDCLQSVPLNATSGTIWVDSLFPYVDWQSTTSYLKNPPPGYLQPAIDVYGELFKIRDRVQRGAFKNEYEFEFTLYELFQKTYDGHFSHVPNLVSLFQFSRPVALVSISADGKALPRPYEYTDVLLSLTPDSTFEPSPITRINGEDAVTYLELLSEHGHLHDPNALYNNLFYELAQMALATASAAAGTFAGGGDGGFFYPNATITLTFENGTVRSYDNYARVSEPFTGVQSGNDVYSQYLAPSSASTSTTSSSSIAPQPTHAPGYPQPVVRQSRYVSGYYLADPGYQDVAVLSVSMFLANESKAEK